MSADGGSQQGRGPRGGGPGDGRVRAVDEGVPEDAWRRVHPISPVLNAWKALAALLAVIVYQNTDLVTDLLNSRWARERGGLLIAAMVLGALLLFLLVAGAYSWLAWRATSYAVTDNAVWYRSGILFRSQRHARLDRIQAVDVVHPLLGRLFGLGRLSVEVAGGSGSNLTFGYLTTDTLDALRAEILARAAGLHLAPGVSTGHGTSTVRGAGHRTPADGGTGAGDGAGPRTAPDGAHRADDGPTAVPSAAGSTQGPARGDDAPADPLPGEDTPAGSALVRPPAGTQPDGAEPGSTAPHHHGASHPDPATGAPSSVPVAHEHELYRVPAGRLAASMLISSGTLVGLLVLVGVVAGVAVAVVTLGARSLTGLLAVVPGVLGVASHLWGRFSGEFNFTAAVSPDGIRIRRGLTETRSQTIPPRRVHAVAVTQPFLWRRMGWYRVTITQAGYAGDSSDTGSGASGSSDVLLPVGTRAEAELAVWLVVRDLGVEDPRAFIETGLHGQDGGRGFVANPRRSRVLDPLSWRRRAVALTRTCLVVRDGRVSHSLTIAPVERLQSLGVDQGPWLRRLGLATLHMHIVPGSVRATAHHVDADVARDLLGELLELGRVRRGSEPPEKWMMRVADAVPDPRLREAIVEEAGAGAEAGVGDGTGAGVSPAEGDAVAGRVRSDEDGAGPSEEDSHDR